VRVRTQTHFALSRAHRPLTRFETLESGKGSVCETNQHFHDLDALHAFFGELRWHEKHVY